MPRQQISSDTHIASSPRPVISTQDAALSTGTLFHIEVTNFLYNDQMATVSTGAKNYHR
jgi:hypothetical protein